MPVAVLLAVLDGYRLGGSDAIGAIGMLRAATFGFTTLEAAGGFGLSQSAGLTFTRLIDSLGTTFTRWAGQQEPW